MTGNSKAEFRAIRERVGLTQEALADMLDVKVDTVKKWENTKYFDPPEYAWDCLSNILQAHVTAVQTAITQVDRIAEQQGALPKTISLTYYRTQTQYDEHGRDKGDFNIINARSREIGLILNRRGIEVKYVYPDGNTALYETLGKTR